ncbi:MAG: cupin domain-containing protein [Flavobacteriaceae bacterium]|nr:cupin domain-containing protein [Flavobacteriaceae bacterium]
MSPTKHLLLLVMLFSLSACTESRNRTKVTTLAKTSQSWNGAALPHYRDSTPEVTVLKITIPPNTKLPVHKHPVINSGYMLQGQLTVISQTGDSLLLNEGDVIVEMVNTWHHGENNGSEPVELVVFYAGNTHTPITILQDSVQNE